MSATGRRRGGRPDPPVALMGEKDVKSETTVSRFSAYVTLQQWKIQASFLVLTGCNNSPAAVNQLYFTPAFGNLNVLLVVKKKIKEEK